MTTLADYNKNETPIEGSLRYGIEKSNQPRTIIFDVSGIIELKRGLYLNEFPNLSIIGQTAPGDGITLKNYNFTFNLSKDPAIGAGSSLNAIVRFLRCVRAISLPIMEKMLLADVISKMPLSITLQPDGAWMRH